MRHAENLLILKALWPSRVACASCLFVLFERLPSAGFGTTGRRVYPHERFQSTPFSGWPMCEQYRPTAQGRTPLSCAPILSGTFPPATPSLWVRLHHEHACWTAHPHTPGTHLRSEE